LVVYWRHFFFQSTSVYSALEADFSALMRYINSRFTYFYLLTTFKYIPIFMSQHVDFIIPFSHRKDHYLALVWCFVTLVQNVVDAHNTIFARVQTPGLSQDRSLSDICDRHHLLLPQPAARRPSSRNFLRNNSQLFWIWGWNLTSRRCFL